MLSDTLASGLEAYRIGPKIRALRLRKKLGLVQLGKHTGLSPGLLSKIERGQLFPTLPTLLRIALVFGVGLEHFFVPGADRPPAVLVRKAERLRLPVPPEEGAPAYFFESLDYPATDRPLKAYYAEFPPRAAPSSPHRHAGTELIYIITGQLAVDLDGETFDLAPGDALSFEADQPHSYQGRGEGPSAALVVVAGR